MFEIADQLLTALDAGAPVAVVTVTRVLGSAPRPVGASMAVVGGSAATQQRVLGAVSGGCAEARAHELATGVLAAGGVCTEHLGFDEWAFATGLSCGGQLRVLAHELDPSRIDLIAELRAAAAGRDAALALVSRGPSDLLGRVVTPTGGDAVLPREVLAAVRAELAERTVDGRCGSLEASGDLEFAVLVNRVRPRLVIVGAMDVAGALSRLGGQLGYRVSVVDARATFATNQRFPDADEVVVEWPARYLAATQLDRRSVIAMLSHEERFDIPALQVALAGPAGYVGAMGSRHTHTRRVALLRHAGVSAEAIARLHSPIGLDLGASTPMETAVSIMAEVIAARTGAGAEPLATGSGAIHCAVVPA
ncbi:XdhC family protein [Micropruina sp.]|uniref:XdhC family protein n=1 Tax=Micropruina sp. TaxID=2737536 RepID=UPI0039E45D35